MNVAVLENLLKQSNYCPDKMQYLVKGFTRGFSIGYKGDKFVRRKAPNLKLRVGNNITLWNKVMKEVQLGRFTGPFENPPFEHYIQSPLGLVPKGDGSDCRLIFHLLYP